MHTQGAKQLSDMGGDLMPFAGLALRRVVTGPLPATKARGVQRWPGNPPAVAKKGAKASVAVLPKWRHPASG